MLTRAEISKKLFEIFAQILPELSQRNIRRAYQHLTMPTMKDGQDYLFYWLSTFDENYLTPTESSFDFEAEQMQYSATKGLVCNCTFYGENSQELALKLEQLSKHNAFQKPLRLNKIFLLPNTQTPSLGQELINAQWWLRADLTLRYYMKVEHITPVNRIENIKIEIYSDESLGDVETGFVKEIKYKEGDK